MMPHLRYLRYVLLHKLYVLRWGFALRKQVTCGPIRWMWRLLVHDLSKFSPAEWGPYVAMFYGPIAEEGNADAREFTRQKAAAFNRAWLHHLHANDHHWQHWILREDSGKEITLIPEACVVDEMICDWLAAGPKVLHLPSLHQCVVETVQWYAATHRTIQLRAEARYRAESTLMQLCDAYGLSEHTANVLGAQAARQSLIIPGR